MDSEIKLREKIIESLKSQGFLVNGCINPILGDKARYKELHAYSKNEQVSIHKNFIKTNIDKVASYLPNGEDIDPSAISLELREVKKDTFEEVLFKWWNLVWWSIPYQKAYGRQMRFLIWDKYHNAPFGLIGLQSPILKMVVRDQYLKIPKETLDYWVNRSLQAQRLGALPPYNQMLGGKLVALALTSNEIRDVYKSKYGNCTTLLKERKINSDLLFLTTTSAFGRSSIYNKLNYNEEKVAISLGYTKGSGTFHIPEDIYIEIKEFLRFNNIDVSTTFGKGPSRKLKLLDIAFSLLKLKNFTYHHIPREYFLFPLVSNLSEIIENNSVPLFYERPFDTLVDYWKKRWCIPRVARNSDWKNFVGNSFMNSLKESFVHEIWT